MKLLAAFLSSTVVCAAISCTKSHETEAGFEFTAVDVDEAPLSAGCKSEIEDSVDGLPNRLSCTGLYSDLENKKVAPGLREYAPAYALWSDGAEKTRWIQLPKGEKIDASDPTAWVFPVGTRAFKEFRVDGRRVETRLYQKVDTVGEWPKATYLWNDDETEAERALREQGKDVDVDGSPYYVPTNRDCGECHNGAKDRLLGFEPISLGLPTASGVTLQDLVDEDLLEGFSGPTTYEIGDDGSGVAADVFGSFHINCGVSCHNGNPQSKGYSRGMRLTLDPETLDGQDSSGFAIATTTIAQAATTVERWAGQTRVIAGDPEQSLLFKLIAQRGADQMPPIATRIPDPELVESVRTWIETLPAESGGAATTESE